MSHYIVHVIMPEGENASSSMVDELLAPFDENEEVDEYEDDCYCRGREAKEEIRKKSDKKFGSYDEIRNEFNARPDVKKLQAMDEQDGQTGVFDGRVHKLWISEIYDKVIKDKENWEEEQFEKHPNKDKVEPKCETCNGTGFYKTHYNPDSKWDWYRIGGRWDGCIIGKPVESTDNGFNFDDEHESLEKNSCLVKDITKGEWRYPYAVVTPDGEWVGQGDMGWWGISTNDKEEMTWHSLVEKLYEQYANHYVVAVDCHI